MVVLGSIQVRSFHFSCFSDSEDGRDPGFFRPGFYFPRLAGRRRRLGLELQHRDRAHERHHRRRSRRRRRRQRLVVDAASERPKVGRHVAPDVGRRAAVQRLEPHPGERVQGRDHDVVERQVQDDARAQRRLHVGQQLETSGRNHWSECPSYVLKGQIL